MDIASAKQQIKNTVQIYLQKDALGRYRLPLVHQRPIFLLGAWARLPLCSRSRMRWGLAL